MNRRLLGCWILAVGLLVLGAVTIAPATGATASPTAQQDAEEFPRAEAGLDQTVQQNASVLLDATESWSPSGEIVDYDWEITSPSGASVDPQCDSTNCGRGRFRVPELGEYTVTVTIEDDIGNRESDTMYVTVVPRGDFSVELTGPSDAAGEDANLTATVAPGNVQVQHLTWYRGDQELANQTVPAIGGVFERSTFIAPGSTYRVVAADQFNRTVNDTWSPPDGSTWAPDSDEFPRIDGPSLVTGSHDYVNGDDIWQFEGTDYNVYTSKYGSVTDVTWGLNNGDSEDFNAHGTQLEPVLDPGVNTIVANLDIELEKLAKADRPGNNTDSNLDVINGTTEREVVLRRRVVVDPKPKVTILRMGVSDREAYARFSAQDPYNSVDAVTLTIDGMAVSERDISKGRKKIKGRVPDQVHGDTTLRVHVEDGRGQVTTKSRRVEAEAVPGLMEDSRIGQLHPSTEGDADDGEEDGAYTSPPMVPWP